MYQQGKEIRLKLELESYFEVAEIQADYDEFVRRLIPESIRGVLFLFAFLFENFQRERAPWSPADLLFSPRKIRKDYDDLLPIPEGERDSTEQDAQESPAREA
jgi:hypothetical protein